MVAKKAGWGLFIVGAVNAVAAAVALLYLHSQHPGTLVHYSNGHRESIHSVGNWKPVTIVLVIAGAAGVVTAVIGLVKASRK